MASKFKEKLFSEIDISDSFFDTLKSDYQGFEKWFSKCGAEGRKALTFEDSDGVCAFIALKHNESEVISMENKSLPQKNRLKVCTLKIAERCRGQRFGEGAIGIILWQWQISKEEEIYLTVYDKHTDLIATLEKFGFVNVGYNSNHEHVFLRSRINVDYSNPYKSFPFINPDFNYCSMLAVEDGYHDTLFPYSELDRTPQETLALNVANGITKVYIGNGTDYASQFNYPVLIFRKYTGEGSSRYKSCITSLGVVDSVICVKRWGKEEKSFEEFIKLTNNKTIFSIDELKRQYYDSRNLVVVSLLYYGYFGAGNNINWDWLNNNHVWQNEHPNKQKLSKLDFMKVLEKGNKNVQDVVID